MKYSDLPFTFNSRSRCISLAVLMLLTTVTAVAQQEYLFVFQNGETSSVYDPLTLSLLAEPPIGPDAIDAVGVPDPRDPTQFSKIYVVRSDSALVPDPAPLFAVRAGFLLSSPVLTFENAVRLSPDGTRLVVLAGDVAHVFDTTTDDQPTTLKLSSLPVGLTIQTNSERAYVATHGLKEVDIISLKSDPPSRLAGPLQLPKEPNALAFSPNARGLFAAAVSQFYEVDPRTDTVRNTCSGPPPLPEETVSSPASRGGFIHAFVI